MNNPRENAGSMDDPKIISQDKTSLEIPVESFIEKYGVSNPEVRETLQAFPVLCYLLGKVTEESQTKDYRPDGIERPIYYLTEGSGMFGLKKQEDTMRWKGIFNHIMGSARLVYYLGQKIRTATKEQREQFIQLGFDMASFDDIDPSSLRNFMLISHCGRRQMDEYNWHDLRDNAHPSGDSHANTIALLKTHNASSELIDLMKVENHEHEVEAGKEHGFVPNVIENILTYCDWIFGQKPTTLHERFEGLRKSRRISIETCDALESYGQRFEDALKQVFGKDIYEELTNADPYEWETKIRQAYCTSSGLSLKQVFPDYASKSK